MSATEIWDLIHQVWLLPVLQMVSNGVYTSIEHRAMVNSARERISMAMFFNPKFSAEIGPAVSLINPQNPPLYRRVGMEKYFKDFFSRKLDGKSFLEHMKIKNGEGNNAWCLAISTISIWLYKKNEPIFVVCMFVVVFLSYYS